MDQRRRITRMRPVLLLASLAFLASLASAQDFEQVLVPFDTMTIPGVGTSWRAELRVRNDGDQPVNLFPHTCYSIGAPFPCDFRIDIPAHTTRLLDFFDDRNTRAGVLLYVPVARAADISLSLHVSASDDPVGVEIPVARRRNYRTGRTTLLNVPLGETTRASLRVYVPGLITRHFTVSVYREDDDRLILQQTFFDPVPTDPPIPPLVPEVSDVSIVLANAALQKPGRVRVTIDVLGDVEYWPLLTVTDNATHRVMAITPQ